ncbi:MAG TPA: hypothetical protein VMR33_13870 [Candidatus Baltobacteraceae bacterium]|nr:hypothetical protein [Candidatus Baltobacteraceae bacterium]
MKPNDFLRSLAGKLAGVALFAAVMPWAAFGQANYAAPYTFTTISCCYYPLFGGIAVDRAGYLYVAEDNAIWKVMPDGYATILAGSPYGYYGQSDGTGTNALFYVPDGVAVDSAGNVYVADSYNCEIRKVTPAGVVTTLAGMAVQAGDVDATGSAARFDTPGGVAVDTNGNIYVADTYNSAIRKVTPAGVVTTLAGGNGIGSADGAGSAASFWYPAGLAVDINGNVYVADSPNNEIRKVTPAGVVTTLAGLVIPPGGAGEGNADGTGSGARFKGPTAVAVDTNGNVYVADTDNNEIRKVMPNGTTTTLGGETDSYSNTPPYSFADGTGSASRFYFPEGVAVDTHGNLYVADTFNSAIRKGVPPVVQLVALEVTQVIQDWHNSIPLIEGKDTYVRAHLQLLPINSGPMNVSQALLYGTGPDGPLPGSPIFAINQPDNSVTVQTTKAADPDIRGNFADSLNFRLPRSWLSGTITLQLTWPGDLAPTNGVADDCSVQVTFVPAEVPQIEFFAVNWTNSGGTAYVVGTDLQNLPLRVQSCYPVPRVTAAFFTLPWPSNTQPTVEAVNQQLVSQQAFNTDHLVVGGQVFTNVVTGGYQDWIYHGAIATESDQGVYFNGLAVAPIPSFVSSSLVQDPYGVERQTVSHEIGHNLGRNHDVDGDTFGFTIFDGVVYALGACDEPGPPSYTYPLFQPFDGYPHGAPTLGPMTEGDNDLIYGLDSLTLNSTTANPIVAPTNSLNVSAYCFDLMSYCDNGPEDVWPSVVTYANLLNNINAIFGLSPPMPQGRPQQLAGGRAPGGPGRSGRRRPQGGPQPQGGGSGVTNYLIVRGTMDFNGGTAQFLPCLPLTTSNAPPEAPPGTNFLLQALDNSGAELQAIEFALEPSIVERNDTNQTAVFVVSLTNDPSIQSLVLWYNGALLATLNASPISPTLMLTTPNGGQNFTTGTVNVAWSGSDADGDTLSYAVEYSADDGATWRMLAVDWPGQTLGVNISELAATTQGLMRVIASDGFNTTVAQSAATFTVQRHPPAVWINAPRDGSIFIGDVQLFLDASVTDMQDGLLDGTNVQWTSDHDGPLGEGDQVTFDAIQLSEGYHTITVTATDSAGLTNSAVTHLWELHYPQPQLSIQVLAGATNATLAWPSYDTNYVLQSSGSLATGWATITNNPPVSDSDVYQQATVSVPISNTNTFFRLMFLP